MSATRAEEKVLAQIDAYLAQCSRPPPIIRVYRKDAAAVVRARQRRKRVLDTDDFLNFITYRDIPVAIYEDTING